MSLTCSEVPFFQVAQVHRNELGQVCGQAGNFQFVDDVVDQAGIELDGGRILFTAKVQWHFHLQLGGGFHALEIDVQNQLLEGVHLHITQQHFAFRAVEFHVQNRGMERFFFDGMPQCVVVQLDRRGRGGSTIHNTGRATGDAETAARTRTLLSALKSDKFHNLLL